MIENLRILGRSYQLRLLYRYRYYTGESRKTLGEAIGATVSAIRSWEDGRHNCSFDDLLKISEHYGISTDYLLGNTPIDDPASAKTKSDPLPPEDRIALLRFEEFLYSRQKAKKK